jgi:ferredoxin
MSNITFSSPLMHKDVTVYAVAGDTENTLLQLAKDNKIPIPCECEDGECGSCLVRVDYVNPGAKKAVNLTDKEINVLKSIGRITKQQLDDATVYDMPPPYRLACQYITRDEDIRVWFSGDPGGSGAVLKD